MIPWSTLDSSSILRSVCRSISAPTTRSRPRDRARRRSSASPRAACSPSAQSSSKRVADPEDDRHPVLLGEQLEEVDELGLRPGDGAGDPVALLGRREVGAEEEHLQVMALGRSRPRPGPAARGSRRACPCSLATLEQRVGVDAGDLLHSRRSPCGLRCRQAREKSHAPRRGAVPPDESTSGPRQCQRRALARHLLGRQHGEVGDLLADPLEGAPGLGLDVAASRGDELLALLACRARSPRPSPRRRPCGRAR